MLRQEFSVNSVTCDIVERTSVGRGSSEKKRGVRFGRSRKLAPQQEKLARGLLCEWEKRSKQLAVALTGRSGLVLMLLLCSVAS